MLFRGCGEEIQPSSSICVVPKPTRFVKQIKPSSPPQYSPKTNRCFPAAKQALHRLDRGRQSMSHSWPYRGQNGSPTTYSRYHSVKGKHSQQNVDEATASNHEETTALGSTMKCLENTQSELTMKTTETFHSPTMERGKIHPLHEREGKRIHRSAIGERN